MVLVWAWSLIVCGILAYIHHKVKKGYWVDVHDIDSHEFIGTCMIMLGAGILIGYGFG